MKKINFLKAIVDWLWIMSVVTAPIIIIFCGYLIISEESLGMPIKLNGLEINVMEFNTKILFLMTLMASGLIIYSLYLFKRVMFFFQSKNIFDSLVIKNLNKIGINLTLSSLLFGIPSFIINVINKDVKLELGLNPFILLFALGLFFMVLSEVFEIAKNMKEDNELTV
jgi:hypothetical protein